MGSRRLAESGFALAVVLPALLLRRLWLLGEKTGMLASAGKALLDSGDVSELADGRGAIVI